MENTTQENGQWRNVNIGLVKSADSWLMVATDKHSRSFRQLEHEDEEWEQLSAVPESRQILGYSAANSNFRKVHLPFKRLKQIEMLLPQEIADNSLHKKSQPRFAFQYTPDDSGADIVYAVTEQEQLQRSITELSEYHLSCGPVVLAELAVWPLLRHLEFLSDETTLIIDASLFPYAVLKVRGEQLLDFRVLSQSVCASNDEKIVSGELSWLIRSLLHEEGAINIIAVGDVPGQCLSIVPNCQFISLDQFAIDDWRWLRALGLTTVNDQDWLGRMLNFRWGEHAFQSPWRQWVKPWLPSISLGSAVLMLAIGLFVTSFWQLSGRQELLANELKQQFNTALPNTPMIDPIRQLQQVLPQEGAVDDSSLIAWLVLVQPLLKSSGQGENDIVFQRLHYDDGGIVLYGSATNYKQLDVVQEGLKNGSRVNSVTLEDASKSSNSELIQFRLRVK